MGRRHTQYLAPPSSPQLSTYNAVDAGAYGVSGLVDEDARVVVEAHDAAVGSLNLFPRPDDDGVSDIATLHLVRGRCCAHAGVACVALLLDDGYYSVTCVKSSLVAGRLYEIRFRKTLGPTDSRMSLLTDDESAFDYGGSGVIDAIKHRLSFSTVNN